MFTLVQSQTTSPTHGHSNISVHSTNTDSFTIIGREDHGLARAIKESIYIRVNNPTLNRNVGKYNLHHIWDRVMLSPPELRITMIMGMHTEHPSVGMLRPSHPVSMCTEQ